ncbi:MAG TPA: HAD family hydrolase, partial [Thermomicrobiales bacterium]|nr:HAD family hydrolase [Thermomicrobiales bacterium]
MERGLDRTRDRGGAVTPPSLKLVDEPAAPLPRLRFHGLSAAEVEDRRQRGLSNGIDLGESRTYREILRQNAFTFINIVLFAISAVLVALGLWGDALATAGLVLINVAVAVIQEARAKQTLDRIALLTRPEATVIRDGEERRVDPAEVVRGDVLVLHPGDQVIVDGDVLTDAPIEVDESLLTGEAEAVRKGEGDAIYSGSFCVSGTAIYEARQVGAASMANQLTQRARRFRQVKTPLQRDIDLIIRVMILLVVAVSGPVVFDVAVRLIELVSRAVSEPFANAVTGAYQGFVFEETVRAAAVIVALVPQGLVLMIAVTYAAAAIRLAGKGALIQQANAIESLSHVDIFCLDKTGTLTTNRLQLDHITAIGVPQSDLEHALADFVASAADQNRTAAAISAAYAGTPRHKRDEIPFSSARKWSAVAFDDPHRQGVYFLGAAEAFGPALTRLPEVERLIAGGAKQGLRMLLFGRAAPDSSLRDAHGEPIIPPAYQPLGVIALRDELRPEARDTMHQLLAAGVEIKIISGDDPRTVAALAKQAGLPDDIGIVSGGE